MSGERAVWVVPAPGTPSLPVTGEAGRFPVRRIFCVGRNYAAHAREMGSDPTREPPFFFSKPADALAQSGETLPYPPATRELHHEVELVVAIGRGGRAISPVKAREHIYGYGIGIDLTRRDLQNEAKRSGRPWDMAKGFDNSAPCSAIQPAARGGHPERGAIWLRVNGTPRQQGDLGDLIWSVPEVIAHLSGLVTLAPGDLIFTGTPEGVGPVGPGDRLDGHVDGVGELTVSIGPAAQ
jgi:fumarylpyruvate hydrolase